MHYTTNEFEISSLNHLKRHETNYWPALHPLILQQNRIFHGMEPAKTRDNEQFTTFLVLSRKVQQKPEVGTASNKLYSNRTNGKII